MLSGTLQFINFRCVTENHRRLFLANYLNKYNIPVTHIYILIDIQLNQ